MGNAMEPSNEGMITIEVIEDGVTTGRVEIPEAHWGLYGHVDYVEFRGERLMSDCSEFGEQAPLMALRFHTLRGLANGQGIAQSDYEEEPEDERNFDYGPDDGFDAEAEAEARTER